METGTSTQKGSVPIYCELKLKHHKIWSNNVILTSIVQTPKKTSKKEDAVPVWLACRRVPESRVKGADIAQDKMLQNGIIESIECSDWIHPMQTVVKSAPKDPVRITVDFSHGINQFLCPVTYPTPHVDDIFNQVRDF